MPLLDLPLQQLKEYGGRNPRPDDFDAYWECALREVPLAEATAREAPVDWPGYLAQDLYFSGVGGARLHAKRLRPERSTGRALLYFHGYTARAPDWWGLLPWAAIGYDVWALDCRGQGGESDDPGGTRGSTHRGHIVRGLADSPDALYYRQVFLDTVLVARLAAREAPVIVTHGASQGGGLALACAALCPEVRACAAVYPFLCDYQRVWEMDLARDAYEELRAFFRMFDPTHAREDEIFRRLGYIDVQHLAPRIQAPTLMVTALMDTITPPSTQFAAYNKLAGPKEFIVYPDFGHEGLPMSNEHVSGFFARTLD